MEEADFFAIDELREVSKIRTERAGMMDVTISFVIPAPYVADVYLIDALFTLRDFSFALTVILSKFI